ncbi:hypothetical protein LEMLEM_LOCUS11764, partial [Lemmus lemmus]
MEHMDMRGVGATTQVFSGSAQCLLDLDIFSPTFLPPIHFSISFQKRQTSHGYQLAMAPGQ